MPDLQNDAYKVNVDRGCLIRMDRATGAAVYMYMDQPGLFYNDHGKIVPPEFAERAGYDIEPLLKLRRKYLALGAAQAEIERQFEEHRKHEIVAEFGEYRVAHVGNELFQVEFEDGTPMGRPVTKEIALNTFKMVSGATDDTLGLADKERVEPKAKK